MSAINRIILAGNGFDIAHDLPTKYKNFIEWYWEKWKICLLRSENKVEDDGLFSFRLKDDVNLASWNLVWLYHYQIPFFFSNNVEKPDIVKLVRTDTQVCDFKSYSSFFDNICAHIDKKGWVDIENEYYNALNDDYFKVPEKLNKEFEIVKSNLIEYLNYIQKKNVTKSRINLKLKNKILAPILINEVAISARDKLIDFIQARTTLDEKHVIDESSLSINDVLNPNNNNSKTLDFIKNCISQMNEYGMASNTIIENAIYNNIVPDEMLYPNRIMLLNFNYTNMADMYIPQIQSFKDKFVINHIHGNIDNPNSIIFGYGDELDDRYSGLVKLNNNEYLSNVKSIKYLESDNYRRMLSFIDSAPYQAYIMGHSCGNSDRTLLNTLFEHKNCISIKPFYYLKENGTDNYLEIVQNISRNFTDMKLMRDRVVNKTYCEPLL